MDLLLNGDHLYLLLAATSALHPYPENLVLVAATFARDAEVRSRLGCVEQSRVEPGTTRSVKCGSSSVVSANAGRRQRVVVLEAVAEKAIRELTWRRSIGADLSVMTYRAVVPMA
jgi:hypothetical protein